MSVNAPDPTQLQLIITTCKTHLNCNLNLKLLAEKILLDDKIIGKKLLGVVEEGLIKKKSKNCHPRRVTKPNKKTTRKDFSNQCTIIIQTDDPTRRINLKIFGNGKIVITGGLSGDDGHIAVQLLRDRILNLTDTYRLDTTKKLRNCFTDCNQYIKYIEKNYLFFLKIFSMYNIDLDLRLDLVLDKKVLNTYGEFNNDPSGIDKLVKYGSSIDLEKYVYMIQIYNVCHLYFTNECLLKKLDDPTDPIHDLINKLFNLEEVVLPVTFDINKLSDNFVVSVENYNTKFNSNFHNNREVFTQILNDKYKKSGLISSAKFEPSNYQGINVKYISRIMCRPDCVSTGKKKSSKCLCKDVSFLIFQEGNVIITGGRSWEQAIDGYNVITGILKAEYHNIVVEKPTQQVSESTTLPTHMTRTGNNGEVFVYINRKTQILENPRNVYLLKREVLLDKYI